MTTPKQGDRFASLPNFGKAVLPAIDMAVTERLWRLYINANDEVDVRALQDQLESVISDIGHAENQASFIIGLSESFSSRGASSDDSFSSVEVLGAFLFAGQKLRDAAVAKEVCFYLMRQIDSGPSKAIEEVSDALGEEYGLLTKDEPYADFFTLPIRVCKVAAWSLTYVYLAEGDEQELAKRISIVSTVLSRLRENCASAFVLISEKQAP